METNVDSVLTELVNAARKALDHQKLEGEAAAQVAESFGRAKPLVDGSVFEEAVEPLLRAISSNSASPNAVFRRALEAVKQVAVNKGASPMIIESFDQLIKELGNDSTQVARPTLPVSPRSARPTSAIMDSPNRNVGKLITGLVRRVSVGLAATGTRLSSGAKRMSMRMGSSNNVADSSTSVLKRSETTIALASALFGDPDMPMVEAPVSKAECKQTFNQAGGGYARPIMRLYAIIKDDKLKVFLQATRSKVFEADLSKWTSDENSIVIRDLRKDYQSTEITNIMKSSPNAFSVCSHTRMLSNQAPQGKIVVESNIKLNVFRQNNGGQCSKNPVFSITGDFAQGRFMIIGRENRQQTKVGNCSGWVMNRGAFECDFEVDELVLFDRIDDDNGSSFDLSGVAGSTNGSPLLIAGILVALAMKNCRV
ncbi:hypothetical protein HDU83_002455 [Entophlyctis luteolus]|nr:hypothetical protein HDU83_002455 [Entophlyctis luteolus]KAJ3385720.1 hypothetical protein HDU84_002064 [Entophlyctis sp. JEL0112]